MNFFYSLLTLIILSGCEALVNHESIMPFKDQSHAKNFARPVPDAVEANKPELPELVYKEKFAKKTQLKVSLSTTQALPLNKLFVEIGRRADLDIQLSPTISGAIHYSVREKPVIELLKEICEIADLHFEYYNGTIKITHDEMYAKDYSLQYLNMLRSASNNVGVATDIFSTSVSGSKSGGASGDNGSKGHFNVESINNFWDEVETNLINLTAVEKGSTYTIHRQGGVVTLYATQKQHMKIEKYLKILKQISCSQVLIEAKVIEVNLRDEYRTGINWAKVYGSKRWSIGANFSDTAREDSFLNPLVNGQRFVVGNFRAGRKIDGLISALEDFGYVRTLSSPRITVMNNQSAVLKVAQNEVYFQLKYNNLVYGNNNNSNISVTSQINTIPIGLIMMVQPSIDLETGEIILYLRPTVSSLKTKIDDPALQIIHNNTAQNTQNDTLPKSQIPVVEVREIDSVMRLQNGEVGIMGGLMEVRSAKSRSGLPALQRIPILNDMTGANGEGDYVVELVIALKATIVDNPNPDAADLRLNEEYVSDARPFDLKPYDKRDNYSYTGPGPFVDQRSYADTIDKIERAL